MSLMDSTEIENIEKWLEPTERKEHLDISPKKTQTDDVKKPDDLEHNFSWIKALKETGLDLNLKPQEASNLQDSFVALQQLLSPRTRKNQPGDERPPDQNEERAITMQLSRIMEALGYTRDARNMTAGKDDTNIQAEVDKILKDLEMSLDKVDTVSSESDNEELDPKTLANLLEDELFKDENEKNVVPIKQQMNLPEMIKTEAKAEDKPEAIQEDKPGDIQEDKSGDIVENIFEDKFAGSKVQSESKISITKEPEEMIFKGYNNDNPEPKLSKGILPGAKVEENAIFKATTLANTNTYPEQKSIQVEQILKNPTTPDIKLATKAVKTVIKMQKKDKKCSIF